MKRDTGVGPQVLVHVSVYQGKPFWGYPIFDPRPILGIRIFRVQLAFVILGRL